MQHQETAVRAVQTAGADTRKIGDQHIVFGLVFDAAEQRAEQRVVFDYYRRAVQAVVVHHQVDAVAGQHRGQCLAPDFIFAVGSLEQLQVLDHVVHDLVQVGIQLDGILDLLLQCDADLLQLVVQQRLHHLAAQRRQRLVHLPLHRPGLVEIARDLRTQLLLGQRDPGAARFRQRKHFVLGVGTPLFSEQREEYVSGLAVHRETARFGERLELGIGLGFLGLVGLLDALAFGLEILPVQKPGYFLLQRLCHFSHQLPEQPALAGRQAQRARSLRRIEVVQIAQVGRHCFARGGRQHRLPEQRRTPAADLAQHEQVVVGLVHRETEARGRFGTVLADPRQGLPDQFGCVGEAQRIGSNGESELGGCQG